jgi:hypothetical protein
MNEEQPRDPNLPEAVEGGMISKSAKKASADTLSNEQTDISKLTAEEQMALFEETLKEEDWGHQPC